MRGVTSEGVKHGSNHAAKPMMNILPNTDSVAVETVHANQGKWGSGGGGRGGEEVRGDRAGNVSVCVRFRGAPAGAAETLDLLSEISWRRQMA